MIDLIGSKGTCLIVSGVKLVARIISIRKESIRLWLVKRKVLEIPPAHLIPEILSQQSSTWTELGIAH